MTVNKIYQFEPKTTPGPNGTTITYLFKSVESDDHNSQNQHIETMLGEIDGIHYVSIPSDVTPDPQPEEINFHECQLTDEQKADLRSQHAIRLMKNITRNRIIKEVGDIEDQLSDNYKLTEFTALPICYLMAEKAGLITMDDTILQNYGQRCLAVLKAVQSGTLPLRSDSEDPVTLITELTTRVSKTNTIVEESYTKPLQKLGVK